MRAAKACRPKRSAEPPVSDVPSGFRIVDDAYGNLYEPFISRQSTTPPDADHFMIVALTGGSGSLPVAQKILAKLGPDSPLACVLLEHVPERENPRWTVDAFADGDGKKMPVVGATEGMAIVPGTAYLVPSDAKPPLKVFKRQFHSAEDDPSSGDHPIDSLIRSLANDVQQRATAVVLSGQGCAGSRGIRHVYEAGGLVIAQDEDTAEVPSMPRNAEETGFIDALVKPEEIAKTLAKRAAGKKPQTAPGELPAPTPDELDEIFELLRQQYEIDFHLYKPATVLRRLQRRLRVLELPGFDVYVETLRRDTGELAALYHDLLVGVTKFFRNPEAFERLRIDVLPALMGAISPGVGFRAWLPGCASGEEVYSVAILVVETLRLAGIEMPVKIFATDIDPAALKKASAGRYSATALDEVPEELRKRYFVRINDDIFQVAQPLRQCIVFARHDIVTSAPFSRMDLVVCRNLLIYLKPAAQGQVLSLLHFALRKGGALFLGPSESTSMMAGEFDPIDDHWKIYRKRNDLHQPLNIGARDPLPVTVPFQRDRARKWTQTVARSKLLQLYDSVLERVMPPALLLDENLNLIHTFAGAERFLHWPGGRASNNIFLLLREPFRTPVSVAIERSRRSEAPVEPITIKFYDESRADEVMIHIRIELMANESSGASPLLLTFAECEPASAAAVATRPTIELDEMTRQHIAHLEVELQFSRDHLQHTVEELDASNEELQAANEELVASNEELQSSNEEYQSVNEELQTVNTELKRKIAELSQMTSDMEGLLANTGLGVVFVDRERRVRRFTPKMTELFHFLPQDVGRPITHFASKLDLQDLDQHLNTVMEKNRPSHMELHDRQGTPYLLRASPYLKADEVDGAVLTIVDISSLRLAEEEARRLEQMVESSHDAIICTDTNLVVLRWNRGAERLFGYTREEAEGRSVIDTIVPPEYAEDSIRYNRELYLGKSLGRIETLRRRKDGLYLDVLLSLDRMVDDRGNAVGMLAVLQDNSEAKRLACGLAIEKEVSIALAEAPTLDIALPSAITAFHDVLNTVVAEMWVPSKKGDSLECQMVHCAASGRAEDDWRRAASNLKLRKGQGLPGRVWETEQPVWMSDLTTSSGFVRTKVTQAMNLRAAFGFPILTDTSEVLGVMVFFLPYPRVSQPLPDTMLASIGRDIAYFMERRKNEASARENRRRFQAAVRHAPVFVAQCDLDLRYTWVAQGNVEFPPEQILGQRDDDVFPAATARTLETAKLRAISENRVTKCEVHFPFPKGDRHFTSTFEPLHDASGAVIGLNLVAFDVTDLHRALQEQSRLASIIEASPDLVGIADSVGRILTLNPAGRQMLGFALDEEIRGLPLSDIYGEAAAKQVIEKAIPSALHSPQGTWVGEMDFQSRQGNTIPMSQVVIARRGDGEELLYLAMVARDLRERMRTEQELRSLSETLAAIVRGLPEIVFVVDMDGNMTFASMAADSINRALDSPKLPVELTTKIRAALEKGEDYLPADFKAAHALRIGHKVHYLLPQITAFKDAQGERLGALIVLQDITEFRLLDEVKSNLIGTVSHELKTPLTGIRMPLLMVLDESDKRGRLNDRQRKLLQSASDEVERMLTTLTMLLDLTRFEEGSQAIPAVPCQPGDLVEDAARQLKHHATHANVTLATSVSNSLPLVSADSTRIHHVLTNLISNALKHAPEESTVVIGARKVKSGVRFYVSDEGPGISKEYHKRLFDRFFKVPGSEGTGLGLAIVREFVRAHGGSVGVKSTPGEGSSFYFTLPAKESS